MYIFLFFKGSASAKLEELIAELPTPSPLMLLSLETWFSKCGPQMGLKSFGIIWEIFSECKFSGLT